MNLGTTSRTLHKADAVAPRRLNIFVHLATDKDSRHWKEAWKAGTLVGINEETPYGYGRAERMDCQLTFSQSYPEAPITKFARLAFRLLLGFDIWHAMRQRTALAAADVIWTHTESQYLAVAAILAIRRQRPKILGQSIWLFDNWHKLDPFRRALYRWLIRRVDVLTVHSSENFSVARKIFPNKLVSQVLYGICSDNMKKPIIRTERPFRVLAPGSDRHRDWSTFVNALDGLSDVSATILSGSAPRRLARGRPYLQIGRARTQTELTTHFDRASVVCVPLKPNLHASGITVIQEAVLAGVPLVVSDTGGLRDYFGPNAVLYVPPGDPVALRTALQEIARNPDAARLRAVKAQERMVEAEIGAESFVRRHVELSYRILKS